MLSGTLQVAGIKITTCHNFDVHAPFRWQCSNYRCVRGRVVGQPLLAGQKGKNHKFCAQHEICSPLGLPPWALYAAHR
jgi:hypothetical protein